MKKKNFLFATALTSVFILSGCGGKDVTEYIDVEFEGFDGKGKAEYVLNENKYLKDVFGFTGNDDYKTLEDISAAENATEIELDKDTDLSNGDKVNVIVTVDEEQTDKIKSGQKEFEVKGLKEPEKITDSDLEKNTAFLAEGYSGRATGKLTYNPDGEDLPAVEFEEVNTNKGEQAKDLKNGDKVQYKVSNRDSLAENGYNLEGKGIVEKRVEGLKVVPENVSEIKNLDEIKRVIKENNDKRFEDVLEIFSDKAIKTYKVKEEQMYYRQFKPDTDSNNYSPVNSAELGSLVGIYTVKEYDSDKKLTNERMYTLGVSNIILDDNEKVNITQLEEIKQEFDSSTSLETAKSTLEGLGYKPI